MTRSVRTFSAKQLHPLRKPWTFTCRDQTGGRDILMMIESYEFGCMLEKSRMEFGSGSDEQTLLPSCHLMPRLIILSSPRVLMMIES